MHEEIYRVLKFKTLGLHWETPVYGQLKETRQEGIRNAIADKNHTY